MTRPRPRLVQVVTRLIVGGAQGSMLALCADLSADFEVTVVCGPQTGAEGSLHAAAREVAPLVVLPSLRREINPRWDPVAVSALRRTFARLRPDVVHTHSSKAGIVGRFASAKLKIPTVHTVHGWGHTPDDPRWRSGAFVRLERAAARRCQRLIAVSEQTRSEGLALGIGHFDQYRVIPEVMDRRPTHVDPVAARRCARETLELPHDVEVLGWVGRFVPQKDPSTLARALAAVLSERSTCRAVLIGDGPARDHVRDVLSAGGVIDRVSFLGVVPNARALMPAFDVLLHPSRWEGQPLVVQEALAEQIPVVSARVSGVPELIDEGVNGFVVAQSAPDEMAAAAIRLLDAPQAARRERRSGDRGASLTVNAVAEHRELYADLLGERWR